jgi:glutamyl-tRNA reductase
MNSQALRRHGSNYEQFDVREPSSIESARDEELDRALRLLRRGVDPARILDELSRRLMNKLIHAPTKALREAG